MNAPTRILVGDPDGEVAVARWGEPATGKPVALLLHGTGFVAEVWAEVAEALATDYTVYAIDRRGHGLSHKPPADRYHFEDFADDVCNVVDGLDLHDIYGIGHSAGATDLLLAAKLMPDRFARLFVTEPTVMDPRAPRAADLSEMSKASVQGTLRRRAEFDSADGLFQRLRLAPAFAPWTEPSLWSYVHHGFATLDDGRMRLRCTPEIEAALLLPIMQAMEQIYAGDSRGNPFPWISEIACPVRIATAEQSWPVYKEMADRAAALIPHASRWRFDGVGHCVAQEAPELMVTALRAFAAQTDDSRRNDPAASPL
ncbi:MULTISPECIES: alpha/beta hydrolase [Bradyrhizobium]|jgi:pimeloyl-ACP methyl ester carboxylesterase|uniref:alpha/beta fold hydrolase n=1 Tax=Bradyrhizobium TaxID=374 RepID=UPI0003FA230E|nr:MULTISPECIES: alpha/beta hydrolase [Bradyrhizobium]MBK5651175.1 alpha/beta hydrolase [Rhizobium sp.]